MKPKIPLNSAAANDNPNVTFNDDSKSGSVSDSRKALQGIAADLMNKPASGMITSSDTYIIVKPIVRPKPGRMDRDLSCFATEFPATKKVKGKKEAAVTQPTRFRRRWCLSLCA